MIIEWRVFTVRLREDSIVLVFFRTNPASSIIFGPKILHLPKNWIAV